MSISPELTGRVPRISMAATALVALTMKSMDSQTKEHVQPTPEIRHVIEPDDAHKAKHLGRTAIKHKHNHSQTHPTPAMVAKREVTPQEFTAWSKVNVCEEGGDWHVDGPMYAGGLGISKANWVYYGGDFFSHSEAAATPDEQIVVAMRIQKNPPDQNGCDGSW